VYLYFAAEDIYYTPGTGFLCPVYCRASQCFFWEVT